MLGLLGWKVTVISSNFIALMLILTMAMNIHMSTRFLQIKEIHPNKKIIELITLTTNKMFWPILYTALTTIIAFLSLIFSEIKPIIDFGWMMTLGLITSFIITFTLLPSLINFMPKDKIFLEKQGESKITSFFAQVSINNHKTISIKSIIENEVMQKDILGTLDTNINNYLNILNSDNISALIESYKNNCWKMRDRVRFLQNNIEFEGILDDITDTFEILIKVNGELKKFNSGELSFSY